MEINVTQIRQHLEEYKELSEKLKKLQLEYVFLLDIKSIDECKMQIEKYDAELTSLKSKLEEINELTETKKQYEELHKRIDVLYEFLNIQTRIRELKHIIVNSVLNENAKENENNDIRETLLQEIRETKDFK